jgi:hypothetical protein
MARLKHEPRIAKNIESVRFGGTPRCKHCNCTMDWLNKPFPEPDEDCPARVDESGMDILEFARNFMQRTKHPGFKLVVSDCMDEIEQLRTQIKGLEDYIEKQAAVIRRKNEILMEYSKEERWKR